MLFFIVKYPWLKFALVKGFFVVVGVLLKSLWEEAVKNANNVFIFVGGAVFRVVKALSLPVFSA